MPLKRPLSRLYALAVLCASFSASAESQPEAMQGGSIGTINIDNASIFDLDDPAENKALYRLANRAHITTRPDVIRAQLLFEPGDEFSPQRIEESERLLRSNRYIHDATIKPMLGADGVVDINVTTTDVWTLVPKISLSRSGGKNNSAFGIKEMNLLGSGIAVDLQYKQNVDRDSVVLKMVNNNLGRTRYRINTMLASNSDGHTWSLGFGQPFYSLDTRKAKGFSFLDNEQIESFYDRGEVLADYLHQSKYFDVYLGRSKGLRDGWTKRLTAGFAYDASTFSEAIDSEYPTLLIPGDRKLAYPFVGVEWIQDRFEKASNYDQINQIEDRFLGTRISARLGLASPATGSDREAWIINASAQRGFGTTEDSSLLLGAAVNSRLEDGTAQNLSLDMSARYFRRQSEHRLLYVGLSGTYGENLDLDQHLLLGGDSGLRGYPLRYQTGDKRALLTIEQRFFTDWYPFRLFRVGGAIFFDAGRAWGAAPVSSSQNDWLKDIGLGLRLGNTRSGHARMAHIDIAYPLDGDGDISNLQFIVSTKKSF